jgi:hypothetical protein
MSGWGDPSGAKLTAGLPFVGLMGRGLGLGPCCGGLTPRLAAAPNPPAGQGEAGGFATRPTWGR